MKIKICFPYYRDCPIYDILLEQARKYKGQHTFIFKKAKGTIVHDVRNILVAETLRISRDFKLPDFDVVVMIDSDIECSIHDIVYIAEKAFSENCIFGLPYLLRGSENKYNAGFIGNYDFEHLRIQTKGVLEIDGQGNGCKAIPRKVFESIEPFWFWPGIIHFKDGSIDTLVEDWNFDYKARHSGFKILCDFDRQVGHYMASTLGVGGSRPEESPKIL